MTESTKQIQTKRTHEAFYGDPKTMLEVAKETGILRGNICRYCDKFLKQGKIVKVWEAPCPISNHKAGFYSTHPKYFPDEVQSDLFPETTNAGPYAL